MIYKTKRRKKFTTKNIYTSENVKTSYFYIPLCLCGSWKENNLRSVLSFDYMGPRYQTQILLSHFPSPEQILSVEGKYLHSFLKKERNSTRHGEYCDKCRRNYQFILIT